MQNKEIEEAIKSFKNEYENCNYNSSDLIIELEMAETVLNLIKELQEETEKYKQLYNRALSDLVVANKNNLDKDKMIALMAEHIVSSAIVDDTVCAIKFCEIEEDCTHEKMLNCTKQYFKKKAQEIK